MPKRQPRKRQVIIYARFSPRPNATDCDSIEKQVERLTAWATARDLPVAGVYSDADKTGGSTDGREGLQDALRHAIRIRGILAVYDLDRLSRKALDALAIAESLQAKDVELFLLVEQVDTTTPMGRLMFGIKAAMGQYVRESTAARTSAAMLHHQYKGARRMGRADRVPFGFRVCEDDDQTLENDPEERQTILRILEMDQTGVSARGICRQLDREGHQRRGKTWGGAHQLVATIIERAQRLC